MSLVWRRLCLETNETFNHPTKWQMCFKQCRRGHWTVNYAGTQSFITNFYYFLAQKRWFLHQIEPNLFSDILLYSWVYLVYHHWVCTSIYCLFMMADFNPFIFPFPINLFNYNITLLTNGWLVGYLTLLHPNTTTDIKG